MGQTLHNLFDDCHRRVGIQESREGLANLETVWAALGFPSDFKGAARAFFRPIHKETPRVLNWYKLTDAGRAEYVRRYAGKPGYFEKGAA